MSAPQLNLSLQASAPSAPRSRIDRRNAISARRAEVRLQRLKIVDQLKAQPELLSTVQAREVEAVYGCSRELAYRCITEAREAAGVTATCPTNTRTARIDALERARR
jgi:hypothetical protein